MILVSLQILVGNGTLFCRESCGIVEYGYRTSFPLLDVVYREPNVSWFPRMIHPIKSDLVLLLL